MASHLWPDVNIGTRKDPLPGAPTVGVSSKHQRVNLCYCASDPDGVLKDTRFILVRAECPYVYFMVAAHVICTKNFIVGGTNWRERDGTQVSNGKVERMPRARLLLGYVSCVEFIRPSSGASYPPFYRPRGSRGYRWEKEEKTKGREGPSRVPGLTFPLILPC